MKKRGFGSVFAFWGGIMVVFLMSGSLIIRDFPSFFSYLTICVTVYALYCIFKKIVFLSKEKQNSSEEGSIESYMNLSAGGLVKRILKEDLERERGEKTEFVSRKALICRMIITGGFSVGMFVLLSLLWDIPYTTYLVLILTSVYSVLMVKFNTEYFLGKSAKAFPDKPLKELFEEDIIIKKETRGFNLWHYRIICAAMILVSVASFVAFNAKNEIKTVAVEAGCSVSRYKLGLFDDPVVVIPETVDGLSVVSVSEKAFANNRRIKRIELPDTVLNIEKSAFINCISLSDIKLSEKTVKIDSAAFQNCSNLKNITLPESLKELNAEVFMNCILLESVEIPEGVTEIRGNAFEGCEKLKSVTLHDGIVDIHAYAFRYCSSLENIILPQKITEIHANTFQGCTALEEIDIPTGVTRIAAHAFRDCSSLRTVNIPDTLTEIGSSAFRDCEKLNELFLPDNVSIKENSFEDSPTKIYKKIFDDETMERINNEIENKEITEIYAAYYTESGKPVTVEDDEAVVAADSEHLQTILSDGMSMHHFETPTEFLEYLRKCRAGGAEKVKMNYYSEIASEVIDEVQLMYVMFDIDELIESYENDPTEF